MPSGTRSDSNTALVGESDGQEMRHADLKGIPTNHRFTRSTWATENFRGPALSLWDGSTHSYDARSLLGDCDAAFLFLWCFPVQSSCCRSAERCCASFFFQGTSDIRWGHPVRKTRWEIREVVDVKLGRTNLRMLMGDTHISQYMKYIFFLFRSCFFTKGK